MAIPALIVAAAGAVASAAASASASSRQASAAAKVADYNANLDIANAKQSALNAQANITAKRKDDSAYTSAQRAAYAADGILSGTGSPMALQAETVGRQEQDIQQFWTTEQQNENTQYDAAELGVYEGAEQASAYHLEGAAEIFQGIGSAAVAVAGGYKSGVIGGGTAPTATGPSFPS